jgi:NADPH2:quinone reductase
VNHVSSRDEVIWRANDIFKGIREGWLKLRIDHRYPLENAHEAHMALEERKTTGKIILIVN